MEAQAAYDVVVVGARCAGAALATFLAQAGVSVLVVDRDPLPSDQILSTHTIHPLGVAILDELGVGGKLREVTPESPRLRLRKGTASVDLSFANGRHELCPRRERLDALLQAAATSAGAAIWDKTRMRSVLFDDARVVGVEVERAGRREQIRVNLVVGADGRRSAVAQQVGAKEYMGYDAPRAMYWGYWETPHAWRTDAFPFDMYLGHEGLDIRVIFQTDNDQLLIGSLPPADAVQPWQADPLASLKSNLSRDPYTGELIAGTDPVGSVRGTVKERYFFREAAGDGWALVGDAGHHKEFVVGDGITEALIQAKGLSSAVLEGSDASLKRWWRKRDVEALPGFFWGRDEGSLSPPGELESLIVARVGRDERLQRLMTCLPERRCTPYDALPAGAVLTTLLGALVRGRLGVIPEFIVQGRRISEYKKEMSERRRRLEEANAAVGLASA